MEFCKEIIDVLNANDMGVGDVEEQGYDHYVEVEFYSPAGEDVCETVWFDGTDAGFIRGFRAAADSFDPDEHAGMWVEHRGENGVPYSLRALIDDADWIRDTLLSVADQLEALKI